MPNLTDPYTGMFAEDILGEQETIQALRMDAIAEMDAINLYQAHINTMYNEQAKELLEHVRDQEKEHLAEFIGLLQRLDPTQADYVKRLQESGQVVLPSALQEIDQMVMDLDDELIAPSVIAQQVYPPTMPLLESVPKSLPMPAEQYGKMALEMTPSELGGNDGYVIDAGLARATKCTRIDLGPGRNPLVYSPGIVGALDEEQEILYCQEGFIEREASEAQLEHIETMSDAAKLCSSETAVLKSDPKAHLNAYFTCLGRELSQRHKGA